MQLTPFDLVGGFYRDDSLPADAQDCVNWIPESSEVPGGRTPTKLRDAPGLRPYIRVGTGPIRGMRNVEGKLMVVSGNTLYQVTLDGVAIPRGTIPGITTCSLTHNQRGTANQVLIVNGSAGYVYDTAALTLERVTDPGYPGAFIADFVDGYLPQIEPQRRFWFHSELRQALGYNTLDRYPAEGQPDALVTLIVDHREVWVFGERSTEVYVNTGALTNTFQRASNTVIEQGCSARFSPAKIDNSMMWLDDFGIIRRAQGYTPVRVSTGAIERDIRDLDWSRAFGYTMTEQGHAIYYLTFPDGKTWGYDIVTGLWHRRASYGLNRWRPSCMAYWNGEYVAGDYQQGLIYAVDWDYPFDGVLPHVRERATGVTHSNQNRVVIPCAEIIAQTGEKIVEPVEAPEQPTAPTITGAASQPETQIAYSYQYTLADGTPPYVVTVRSGALPTGLTIDNDGLLSGTPTASGEFTWTLRVTDANGLYDEVDDSATVVSYAWLFGPVAEDGASGGSELFYLRADTPEALASSTPIPLPAQGSGALEYLSVANGAIFMARSTLGCVSFDRGATWSQCNIPLSTQLDTYWNGNFYFNGRNRSADGITWAANPAMPSVGANVLLGRDSDGVLVSFASNTAYTSVDDAGSWQVAWAAGVNIGPYMTTDGSRIWYLARTSALQSTDDLFANVTEFGDGDFTKPFYSPEGIVFKGYLTAGAGRFNLDNTGYEITLPGVSLGTDSDNTIAYGNGTWAAADFDNVPTPDESALYVSTDAGDTWSLLPGTLYGGGRNLVFVEQA